MIPTAKATVLVHSDPIEEDCPVLDGSAREEFRTAARAANAFSVGVLRWLERKSPKAKVAWIRTSVNLSRDVFQPWTMEILFLLSTAGSVRFTELQGLLGVSSRTLSDRLKFLAARGFVTRTLHDEQPVRVEYALTKHGLKTASLANALVAHLGLEALKRRAINS